MTPLILSGATTACAVLASLLVITHPRRSAVKLPACVLFFLLGWLAALPVQAGLTPAAHTLLLPLALPVLLSIPPVLGALVGTLAVSDGAQQWHDWRRHAAAPAAGLIVAGGFCLLPLQDRIAMLVDGHLPHGGLAATVAIATFAMVLLWCALSVFYGASVLRTLSRYRRRLKDLYANTDDREHRWLDGLIVIMTAFWAAIVLALLSDNLANHLIASVDIALILCFGQVVYLSVWSLRLLSAVPPVGDPSIAGPPEPESREAPARYSRSALSADQSRRIAEKIHKAMQADALYLDPNLSLYKLSLYIGASPNMVSQTLNETIGETFFDHVNRWRVEAATMHLRRGKMTTFDIALTVGFNSRSTFYKAFNRRYGKSPGAYSSEEAKHTGAPRDDATLVQFRRDAN